jgi:signal transduction histidine kinase
VSSKTIPAPASNSQGAAADPQKGSRSALAHLLHALNQPLTGLQCSMEVALASPRTIEQYVRGLREGLELTERMRTLVEAIREVTDIEGNTAPVEVVELRAVLGEVVDDLKPVAEVKRVRITLPCSPASLEIRAVRPMLATALFRLLESALSLAAAETELRIEAGGGLAEVLIRLQWSPGRAPGAFSHSELGLLIAQAGWERIGAQWERERIESVETVTVRLAGFAGRAKF